MPNTYALTQQQIACLQELEEDHELVITEDRLPIVRGPRGEYLRITASGRLVPLVESARSYLAVNG
jgi:hypothetical protein